MNVSRFTIRRPVLTIMVVCIVLILGGISLRRLPIDLMPDITNPTLSIGTMYENASPQEIESLITRPMEEAMAAVPGVEEVSSTSREGQSRVRLTFAWGTNLDAAADDVRERLDRVQQRLPEEAEKPTLFKFDLASFPILILGAYGNLDPVQMRLLIENEVKTRVERVPGVASLDIWGGLDREIHVNIDVDKIKALNLPLDQVLNRIRAGNLNVPAGTIERGTQEVTLRVPGEYASLDELRRTVVAVRDGVPVELADVAQVVDAWEKETRFARVNGKPGIRLGVLKQSGTNTVEVADRVLEELSRIQHDFPQIRFVAVVDTSKYIRQSITNLARSAMWGGALAVLVLLLFLRNIRSTVIIALAIPISIVATFVLMYFAGFTMNIMTLGGLALGVGMLLDSSIVVLENIYRLHEEEGLDPDVAAETGAGEVTAAIIASTLTTVVVFLPLIFIRGMSGVMFKQLSTVVAFSLLCSLVVSLTLVPMLAAKLLKRSNSRATQSRSLGQWAYAASGQFLQGMQELYGDLLHWALNHRLLVALTALALLGASLALVPLIGSELMPAADEGDVRVNIEMAVGTRVDLTDAKMKEVEERVRREVPEMDRYIVNVGSGGGPGGGGGSHAGSMQLTLVPMRERTRSSEQVADALRPALSRIPGLTVRTRAGQGLFLLRMGTTTTDRVEIEIRGYDIQTADALGQKVKSAILEVEGIKDVRLSREAGAPEELILIDRQKAESLGLSVTQISSMLQTALSGTGATNFREGGDEFRILVKLRDAENLDLEEILDLKVTNNAGEPVALKNVVSVEPRTGPVQIERKNQERVLRVYANIVERDLGSLLTDVQTALEHVPVPKGFSILLGGDYEEQQKAQHELLLTFVLAVILVYMVMACQYESLRDPFIVMFSVPLAVIGVALILFLTHTTFNIQSYIGCIMLGGIVVNNAILLVDHTNLLRRRDALELRPALEEAGRRRLRPILMTSLTTVLGLLPLALGLGEGGEAQAPLARAVIGGLASSMLITLIFVPTVYSFLTRRELKEL